MRCGACGCKETPLKNAKGRGFPYMMHERVILTVDIDLHTCVDCGNMLLKGGDCKRLDEAIERSLDKLEE